MWNRSRKIAVLEPRLRWASLGFGSRLSAPAGTVPIATHSALPFALRSTVMDLANALPHPLRVTRRTREKRMDGMVPTASSSHGAARHAW